MRAGRRAARRRRRGGRPSRSCGSRAQPLLRRRRGAKPGPVRQSDRDPGGTARRDDRPFGGGQDDAVDLDRGIALGPGGQDRGAGRDLSRLGGGDLVEVRRDIGFIFQMHNLFDALSAYENVKMAAQLGDAPGAEMRRRGAGDSGAPRARPPDRLQAEILSRAASASGSRSAGRSSIGRG